MMSTMALVYVIEKWDDFTESMRLDNGPEGPDAIPHLFDEIAHHTVGMLLGNEYVLKVLFMQWGKERVEKFVEKLTKHEHTD